MPELFDSSDSVRTAKPLRYAQTVDLPGPVQLELGGELPGITVCYETYGALNPAGDNAVLICHALSGDSHVAKHDDQDDPGWWDIVVGPGKPIDTNRYFVICPNLLGGCRGTTGPGSINPATGKPYGRDFPTITIGDMVETQRRLLDHLGIRHLRAVVGGSMGGHTALTWATRRPDRVRGCIALATSVHHFRLPSNSMAICSVSSPTFISRAFSGETCPMGMVIARSAHQPLSRQAVSTLSRSPSLSTRWPGIP